MRHGAYGIINTWVNMTHQCMLCTFTYHLLLNLLNSPYLCLVIVMPAPTGHRLPQNNAGGGVRGMVRQLMSIIHEQNTASQMHVSILLVKFVRTAPSGILQNFVNAE